MKNLLLVVVFVASVICASAQKVYFIYLQSDNNNAFYVKMNDKIYTSSSSGYLILSNLVDSTYNFSIGFPPAPSEPKFIVPMGGKDRGFLIKNFQNGLGLFDLQNLTIISAQKEQSEQNISYQRRNDGFSSLLSKAANDTSLLYAVVRIKEDVAVIKQQPKTEEVKQKTEIPVLTKDTAAGASQSDVVIEDKKLDSMAVTPNTDVNKIDNVLTAVAKDASKTDSVILVETKEPIKPNVETANLVIDTLTKNPDTAVAINNLVEEVATFKRSQVKKHSESSTSEGFGLVFYDKYNEGQDTIRLLIPNPPIVFKQTTEQDSVSSQKDFIQVQELKKDTVQQIPIVVAVKNNTAVKSQCKAVASNNDFFKLRKNMAAESTDEGMVAEAKKFFKNKCFTTEQIKNLSALFLTSAGKYQFFDAAYLHVSDQQQFSSLESEIKDDYYLKRFKALIGE